MKTLLKGEVSFTESYKKWIVNSTVKWNKKRIQIVLKSRKTNLKSDFDSCNLSDANFLSFISRSDSYNFSGKRSKYSELIFESAAAQSLMNSRNASIKLKGKSIIFKGQIPKKDETSLSNIFILNEMLMEDIETLNDK